MKRLASSIIASMVFLLIISMDPIGLQRSDMIVPELNLNGLDTALKPALAATTNSGAWEFVRRTASFARTLTMALDTILNQILGSSLVLVDTYHGDIPGTSYKIDWNRNASETFTRGVTGALLGNATYTRSLRIFNMSDQMLVEMYFNPEAGGGMLVRYMPSRINPALYGIGTGIGECQVMGAAGSRTMICSLSGGPFRAALPVPDWDYQKALVKAQEVGGHFYVTALTKTSTEFDPVPVACGLSDQYYFPLAYIATNTPPYYTTGKFGFNVGLISQAICGTSNDMNYGLFNINANPYATDMQKYFYMDGVDAGAIPAGYPAAANVDTLFDTIASGSGDGVIGKDVFDSLALAFHNDVW